MDSELEQMSQSKCLLPIRIWCKLVPTTQLSQMAAVLQYLFQVGRRRYRLPCRGGRPAEGQID